MFALFLRALTVWTLERGEGNWRIKWKKQLKGGEHGRREK